MCIRDWISNIVFKLHERTQTNNVLACLSVHSDFYTLVPIKEVFKTAIYIKSGRKEFPKTAGHCDFQTNVKQKTIGLHT